MCVCVFVLISLVIVLVGWLHLVVVAKVRSPDVVVTLLLLLVFLLPLQPDYGKLKIIPVSTYIGTCNLVEVVLNISVVVIVSIKT